MSRSRLVALAAAFLVLSPSVAARAQELARLFPREADVFIPGPGLARLPLPPAVLAAAAADLSDVRLFDRAGNEVPYLVDPGLAPDTERREERVVAARVVDLTREEISREPLEPRTREVYRVALPEMPPAGDAWALVVESSRPRFVRSVEVRGVAPDGSTATLVPRASLVRLGQPSVDRSAIPLPRFDGSEIVVTIEGEEGFFLEPRLGFASGRAMAAGGSLAIPLAVRDRRHDSGRTILEVERPPGLVPARLRIDTTTAALDRAVTVWDLAVSGATSRLGTGRIVRAARAGAGDGKTVEHLEVEVRPARGERIRVEIDDGDSPPLADVALSIDASQPALIFALPAGPPAEAAGILRFGGDRGWRPRYDIAHLFRDARVASRGNEQPADPAALPVASLGAVRANPLYDPRPALAAVAYPGAAVDASEWRWRRALVVPESPEGLVRVRLAPEDVAHAAPGYGDLRVIDASGRQWPYLIAPAQRRERLPLTAVRPERKDGVSRWRIAFPAAPLALDRLVLSPARPVLGRPYRVVTRGDDGEEKTLGRGTLAQDIRRPAPIEIPLAGGRIEALELVVEDGDDAPLEIAQIEASLLLPELLLAAPAGEYALVAGNPDASTPEYELARARDVVVSLRSVPATPGVGAVSSDWHGAPGGRARSRARLQQIAVWSAIGIAVVLLIAVTLRVSGAK